MTGYHAQAFIWGALFGAGITAVMWNEDSREPAIAPPVVRMVGAHCDDPFIAPSRLDRCNTLRDRCYDSDGKIIYDSEAC